MRYFMAEFGHARVRVILVDKTPVTEEHYDASRQPRAGVKEMTYLTLPLSGMKPLI